MDALLAREGGILDLADLQPPVHDAGQAVGDAVPLVAVRFFVCQVAVVACFPVVARGAFEAGVAAALEVVG